MYLLLWKTNTFRMAFQHLPCFDILQWITITTDTEIQLRKETTDHNWRPELPLQENDYLFGTLSIVNTWSAKKPF